MGWGLRKKDKSVTECLQEGFYLKYRLIPREITPVVRLLILISRRQIKFAQRNLQLKIPNTVKQRPAHNYFLAFCT
jgi:hypothetical protein